MLVEITPRLPPWRSMPNVRQTRGCLLKQYKFGESVHAFCSTISHPSTSPRFQDRAHAVGAVGFIAVDSPSTPALTPGLAPAPPVIGYGDSPVNVSPVVDPSGQTHSYHSPPALAPPVPSFPIWHSWADIYPREDWA
jgi:hypothetical protein